MRIFILIMTVLLAACGDSNGQTGKQPEAGTPTVNASAEQSSKPSITALEPCQMLTEAMIREYLRPGDVEISGKQGEHRKSLYCQYKWNYPLTEAEQQKVAEARMEWTMARAEARRKGEPEPPSPGFPNRDSLVFFNVLAAFENEQIASSSFDAMVQRLSKGMTIKTESLGEIEVQGGEMVLVDGLGDQAVWDSADSQISVLTGTRLFHLKVQLAGGVDSHVMAEQIAAELVKRF